MPSWMVLPWLLHPSAQGLRRVHLRLRVRWDAQTTSDSLRSLLPSTVWQESWAGRMGAWPQEDSTSLRSPLKEWGVYQESSQSALAL